MHQKFCTVLNYIKQSLALISAVPWDVSISTFLPLVGISVGKANSVVGWKYIH